MGNYNNNPGSYNGASSGKARTQPQPYYGQPSTQSPQSWAAAAWGANPTSPQYNPAPPHAATPPSGAMPTSPPPSNYGMQPPPQQDMLPAKYAAGNSGHTPYPTLTPQVARLFQPQSSPVASNMTVTPNGVTQDKPRLNFDYYMQPALDAFAPLVHTALTGDLNVTPGGSGIDQWMNNFDPRALGAAIMNRFKSNG